MTHQLRVRLIGPASETAKFCGLFKLACAGPSVDLALMARVASAACQPIEVFSPAGDLAAELCSVVRGRPLIARRCAGPFQQGYGDLATTTFILETADDCADEFRALTEALPLLTIDVTAQTPQRRGIRTARHAYRGGKRTLTLYQEAA